MINPTVRQQTSRYRREFTTAIRLDQPVEGLLVRGYLPPQCHAPLELRVAVNGQPPSCHRIASGEFSVGIPCELASGGLLKLRITADKSFCPARADENADCRELAALLQDVSLAHPLPIPKRR